MSLSKTQLIRRTLEILGVVGTGQSVSAEDHQCVKETLEAVIASLDRRHIVSLVSHMAADEFPDEIILPLSAIIARHAAPSFGFGGQELGALKMLADDAEQEILSLAVTERGTEPMTSSYF